MSKSGEKDYEVGYGRPPRNGQFKKGESGNPKGRRNGSKSVSDRLVNTLNQTVMINENGTRRRIPILEALAKQIANKALGGDIRFMRLVLEMVGPQSERGRQEEQEAKFQQDANANERLTRKLEQMSERLRAGLPLFPDETEEPETSNDTGDPQRS